MARKYFIEEAALKKAVATYGRAGAGTPEGLPERTARPAGEKKEKKTPAGASELRNQRLLLTWLIDDPGLFAQIREYFSPLDFEEGLYRRAAEALWGRLEQGMGDDRNMTAASLIGSFESPEDQEGAAALFSERIPGDTNPSKTLTEIMTSVKRGTVARLVRSEGSGDAALTIFREKKKQEKLSGVSIHLSAPG